MQVVVPPVDDALETSEPATWTTAPAAPVVTPAPAPLLSSRLSTTVIVLVPLSLSPVPGPDELAGAKVEFLMVMVPFIVCCSAVAAPVTDVEAMVLSAIVTGVFEDGARAVAG